MLALLTRLVDKSMLSVVGDEPEIRYSLLETIREYAGQELADAGEWDDARTRHRDHFLGLADDWATASDYWNWWSWLRSLDADHDNFTAALEWSRTTGDDDALLRLATAHWPYWYWGETLGWRRWLVDAIDRCVTPGPARVEALIALASLPGWPRAGEAPFARAVARAMRFAIRWGSSRSRVSGSGPVRGAAASGAHGIHSVIQGPEPHETRSRGDEAAVPARAAVGAVGARRPDPARSQPCKVWQEPAAEGQERDAGSARTISACRGDRAVIRLTERVGT